LALAAVAGTWLRAESANLNRFKNLTAYSVSGDFRLVFAFEGKPKEKVRFLEKSVEIVFSDATVSPAEKIYEINRAGISGVTVYQSDPQTVRINIKSGGDMKEFRKRLSLKRQDGKFIVNVAAPPPAAAPKQIAEKNLKKPAQTEKPVTGKNVVEELTASLSNIGRSSTPQDEKPDETIDGFLNYEKPSVSQLPSFGESMVKVGGALAIVLALALFLALGARKYLLGGAGGVGIKRQVQVLSNHFIGVKKSVTLVEIGGEILALGVTNENINLLARYDAPEKIERIMLNHRLPDKPMGIFKKLPFINRVSGRKKPAQSDFSRKIENYAKSLEENDSQKNSKKQPTKEELLSNAAKVITSRLRAMENKPGR